MSASVGATLRRLQQNNTRDHHHTECANDFHAEILRLSAACSKYRFSLARLMTKSLRSVGES